MDILRQSLAIALVFALLWLALWLLRKKNGVPARLLAGRLKRGALESRARLVLGPQHSLHIIRIGEKELIMAVHPHGITLLGDTAVMTPRAPGNLE